MFKKLASDALGISDIGIVVSKSDFDKTEADDFVMHESGEVIMYLIKTKSDEYCFTNLALIHVDGQSAISKKRTLKRYDYVNSVIADVDLETAGSIDLDLSIKLSIGNVPLTIDIHKKFANDIKDLYKVLCAISMQMQENKRKYAIAESSLDYASRSMGKIESGQVAPSVSFEAMTRFANKWLVNNQKEYIKKDFSDVFSLYINN